MIRLLICFICAVLFHILLLKFEMPECRKSQSIIEPKNLQIEIHELKYINEALKKEESNYTLELKEVKPKSSNKMLERETKEDLRRKEKEVPKPVELKTQREERASIQGDQTHNEKDLESEMGFEKSKDLAEVRETFGSVIHKVVEEYVPPQYGHNPQPKYPKAARKAGYQGRVLLEVLVAVEGSPKEIKVRESSGYKVLDQAAVEAVQKWQFVPAKRGEVFLEEWVLIPIRFNLEESSKD